MLTFLDGISERLNLFVKYVKWSMPWSLHPNSVLSIWQVPSLGQKLVKQLVPNTIVKIGLGC